MKEKVKTYMIEENLKNNVNLYHNPNTGFVRQTNVNLYDYTTKNRHISDLVAYANLKNRSNRLLF